ncbi:MAG: head-tail connector protein [Pirellulales bacterium]
MKRTSSPQFLAVTLDEAKAHLRVSGSSQDALLTRLIESATEQLERDIERCLVQASWQQSQYGFPIDGKEILLNMAAASAISSITYVDSDGATQTVSASDYILDAGRNAVVCLDDDNGWPETFVVPSERDTVFVNFTCGVTSEDCLPRLFKQAILLEVGRYYYDPAQENGVNTNDGRSYENIVKKLVRSSYP